MTRRATCAAGMAAALLAGCVLPPELSLSAAGPIAVGGAVHVYASAKQECSPIGIVEEMTYCRRDHALRGARSDAPEVIAVEAVHHEPDYVVLRGLRPGRATITAETSGGRVSRQYEVRAPDAVELRVDCHPLGPTPAPSGPFSVPAGDPVTFWLAASGSGEPLEAAEWSCPFDGVDPSAPCATPGWARVIAPGAGETLEVTFRPDPSRRLAFRAYDPAALDGLEVVQRSVDGVGHVGKPLAFAAVASLGLEIPCLDHARRRATIETPETCSFSATEGRFEKDLFGRADPTRTDRREFVAHPTAPGTCRIRVALGDGSPSAYVDVTVVP